MLKLQDCETPLLCIRPPLAISNERLPGYSRRGQADWIPTSADGSPRCYDAVN
jgi:hypothetical protein